LKYTVGNPISHLHLYKKVSNTHDPLILWQKHCCNCVVRTIYNIIRTTSYFYLGRFGACCRACKAISMHNPLTSSLDRMLSFFENQGFPCSNCFVAVRSYDLLAFANRFPVTRRSRACSSLAFCSKAIPLLLAKEVPLFLQIT